MAKKSTDKEIPEAAKVRKPAKKSAESAETKPKATKPKTAKKAASEDAKPAKPRKKASAEFAAPEAPAASPEMVEEQIRVAAYYRWVDRGMCDGCDAEDWIEAEKLFRK
ncbi:hypothetical protein BIU88_05085 [Chlorobaculum limnaeum]|uniref:DUF2934 domain-containing protein n=1 Tax=Chlorobaculum limnaeum TaxID=274537 RepID=A0A1D8D0E2_CHLLM|nr:DUF2934 domain-containing protein [Chlorobaculum limnaeum]AOS83573.1 hypothetical protein BIU88_05085 [Chlorobaculum limnaeum]